MTPDTADLLRIERKVDRLSDAVEKLVLIEERQTTQGGRIGLVEHRLAISEASMQAIERKVDMWINRGIGVWAVAATLFAVLKTLKAF